MLNIVEFPDPSESVQFPEMGLLFPVPGIEKNTIVMEDRDGSNVQRLTASEVIFKVGAQTKFRDRKVKIDLFVTDARFALACSSYDKGGGHALFGGSGALLIGVGVNSVSNVRSKMRSRGKMLVGQVRYPWLRRGPSLRRPGSDRTRSCISSRLSRAVERPRSRSIYRTMCPRSSGRRRGGTPGSAPSACNQEPEGRAAADPRGIDLRQSP